MIEIQDLKELNKQEILDLLLDEKSNGFDIYIPKETQEFFSDREEISMDYAQLAYSGQLLFNNAKEFSYVHVPPALHESVLFKVTYDDLNKLAEILLQISNGYFNDEEDEENNYTVMTWDYLDDVDEGKIKNVACPYFIEISKEFDENDDDDDS